MKKILCTLLFLILMNTIVFAGSINITINGTPLILNSTPYTKNGTTMVPMRIIFENFNAKVKWDNDTKQITATTDDTNVLLTLNSNIAIKNGTPITLPVAPEMVDGITFVPARFIAESFGASVEWDNLTKTVAISKDYQIFNDYVPYSTGSLDTLIKDIANGNVVYFDGQYWATPESATRTANSIVVYENDASGDTTESVNRYASVDSDSYEWVTVSNFDKIMIRKQYLVDPIKNFEKAPIDGYVYVYGFYESGLTSTDLLYAVDVTDEFINSENASGIFSGIRMKKQDGMLFFNYQDLKSRNLINF